MSNTRTCTTTSLKTILTRSSAKEIVPGIAIINDDCMNLIKSLPDKSIDIVITDPPYFITNMGNKWDRKAIEKRPTKSQQISGLMPGMAFDPSQGQQLQEFMEPIAYEISRVVKPGSFFICFSMPRLVHRMGIAIENAGFEIRDMLIWRRPSQPKAQSRIRDIDMMDIPESEKIKLKESMKNRKTPMLMGEFEPAILAQKPKAGNCAENWYKYGTGLIDISQSLTEGFPGNIMDIPKPNSVERARFPLRHATMKPELLMEHLILTFSKENDIILDPFLGSGTSAVAAIHTNRRCIGSELNKEYYDGIIQRVSAEKKR